MPLFWHASGGGTELDTPEGVHAYTKTDYTVPTRRRVLRFTTCDQRFLVPLAVLPPCPFFPGAWYCGETR